MNILNLRDWDVQQVEEGTMIEVTATYRLQPTACIRCGVVDNLYRHGATKQDIHDVPTLGKPMVIHATRPRYRCRSCGVTFSQPLPDLDEAGTRTKRLVRYIEEQSLKRTFTSVAEDTGVVEGTIRNIFRAYVARLDKEIRFIAPEVLGIDELHLLRQPRCILTNVAERTIVGLLETRTKDAVYRHLVSMPDRERVKIVVMDMWTPYRDASRAAFPEATIIVDKFHVVRMANSALEQVRKELRESLSSKMRRGLMHDRFVLLHRERDLDERQRLLLEVWTGRFPTLGAAYRLKEDLYDIWDTAQSSAEARARYGKWQEGVTLELAGPFNELTTAIRNWQDEIFAYFDHRVTNAYTEALNGLVKIANRLGRGYSFEVIRAKVLYTRGSHHRPEAKNAAHIREAVQRGNVEELADGSFGADISTLTYMLQEDQDATHSTGLYE